MRLLLLLLFNDVVVDFGEVKGNPNEFVLNPFNKLLVLLFIPKPLNELLLLFVELLTTLLPGNDVVVDNNDDDDVPKLLKLTVGFELLVFKVLFPKPTNELPVDKLFVLPVRPANDIVGVVDDVLLVFVLFDCPNPMNEFVVGFIVVVV